MGYLVQPGQDPQTYVAFRAATATMESREGEQFVESLDGWVFYQPQYITKQEVYHGFKLYLAALAMDKLLVLQPYALMLDQKFREWTEQSLPTTKEDMVASCEWIKERDNIDATLDADLDRLIEAIKTEGDEK